jgi:hypothetical protein
MHAFAVAATLLASSIAQAGDDPSVVTLGAGFYDLVSHHPHAFQGDVAFRLGDGLFDGDGVFRGLKPMIGGMGASNGALYGYGGFAAPLQWGKFEIEPSAGVGGYRRGNGLDLGGTFEFHLGMGFSYQIADGLRAGISLTHISNANTHHINPGLNSALATIGFAL